MWRSVSVSVKGAATVVRSCNVGVQGRGLGFRDDMRAIPHLWEGPHNSFSVFTNLCDTVWAVRHDLSML